MKHIGALTVVRGIAAWWVVLYHFRDYLMPETLPWLNIVSAGGYLAVDLFFGISGFVLSDAYCERFRTGLAPQTFLELRIVRFYPLYFAGFALGLLALAIGVFPSALGSWEVGTGILLGFFMMPNPGTYQLFPFNGVSWSLFFELVINVMFAKWLWKLPSHVLAAFAAAGFLILCAVVGPPHQRSMI